MLRVITEGGGSGDQRSAVGGERRGHKCMHRQGVPERVCTRLVTLVEMA